MVLVKGLEPPLRRRKRILSLRRCKEVNKRSPKSEKPCDIRDFMDCKFFQLKNTSRDFAKGFVRSYFPGLYEAKPPQPRTTLTAPNSQKTGG